MAVTEIAILRTTASEPARELKTALADAQQIQDKWHAVAFPDSPSSPVARGAAMFQQVEDPSKVLITARWGSVDDHRTWLASHENTSVMDGLASHIASDGEHEVVLRHLEGEIFSAPTPPGYTALLSAAVVRIDTFYVEPEGKDAFQSKLEEVRGILENFVKPNLVRGGWRVDKVTEPRWKDQFLLFSGWLNMEQHSELVLSEDFPGYRDLRGIAADTDTKHYRRFL